jgi:aminoglycoside phosphotransferase
MDREQYRKALEIDHLALDQEWLVQPKLFFRFAARLADKKQEYQEVKRELDLLHAEISKKIRSSPSKWELVKPSNEVVLNTVTIQPEYQDKVKEVNKKRHEVDVLEALVSAMDHKKRALERLVILHGQNYYSTPKVDACSMESIQEVERQGARRRAIKNRRRDQ